MAGMTSLIAAPLLGLVVQPPVSHSVAHVVVQAAPTVAAPQLQNGVASSLLFPPADEVASLPTSNLLGAQVLGFGKEFTGYKDRSSKYTDAPAAEKSAVMNDPAPQTDFKAKYDRCPRSRSTSMTTLRM